MSLFLHILAVWFLIDALFVVLMIPSENNSPWR